MQGYIIHTHKSGDNNLIVQILTPKELIKTMRFYGVRHSSMAIGNKLDFELEHNASYLPTLKNTIHLGFAWQDNSEILGLYRGFVSALERHLEGVGQCDECYYYALEQICTRLALQAPRRAIIDAYATILRAEGRLHSCDQCYVCSRALDSSVHLSSGLLPLCARCHADSFKQSDLVFDKATVAGFFQSHNSSDFDDKQIMAIHQIISLGL